MQGSTRGRVWVGAALLVACTAEPAQNEDSGTPSDEGTAAAPDSTSTAASGDTTVGPAEDTTSGAAPGSSSSASSGGSADDDPGISLDLGMIPDMPNGMGPACQQAIDIVFTMDVSTTMGSFLAILADEILAVDEAIAAYELPLEPHYGLAVFVDDALLVNNGAPYTDAMVLRDDFLMWSSFTASNQQVGGGNSNSTWPENSLDALYFAADEFQWRPAESTLRMIIHTTDDTFWDGPTIGNGIMIQHGYAETVQRMQDQEVRGYVFADDIGGSCECQDVTPGWSSPYMGMLSVPESTDGDVFAIDMVLSGAVSLADAIEGAIEESYCDPYTPQG